MGIERKFRQFLSTSFGPDICFSRDEKYLATSYPKMSVSNTHFVNASLVAVKKVLTRRTRQRPWELHQNPSINPQRSFHPGARRNDH
jgi:hypothetical protein